MPESNVGTITLEWMPRGAAFDVPDDATPAEEATARARILDFCQDAERLILLLVPLDKGREILTGVPIGPQGEVVLREQVDDALTATLPGLNVRSMDYLGFVAELEALGMRGIELPRSEDAEELPPESTAVGFGHVDVPYGTYATSYYYIDWVTGEVKCVHTRALLVNDEPVRLSKEGVDGYADVLVRVEFTIPEGA